MNLDFSIREKRKLGNIIIAALLFLVIWILFSPWGLVKHVRINNELETVRQSNRELIEKNRLLEEEITRLTSDPVYLEEIARKKFGLVRKNELVFDFSKTKEH
ncbi:MAG: septum formation initiator family protein [Proteobacteria bacterium]|nr:septum formation initiator family protein [Pseudomonadota bacterium]MBU1738468.1 septum formation initiator family protein [Pseudomonadota bacterium]